MTPNYAKSARRVFIEAATAIVTSSQSVNLLSFHQEPELHGQAFMKTVPSWVPHFGTSWTSPDSTTHHASRPKFAAGTTFKSQVEAAEDPLSPSFRIIDESLTVTSLFIDTITATSDILS
jgi:hypothetical protein